MFDDSNFPAEKLRISAKRFASIREFPTTFSLAGL